MNPTLNSTVPEGEDRHFVTRARLLELVDLERDRQDKKWGGIPGFDRRDDHTYAAVLTEEVGECCKAWLERDVAALREELIQVAAVAVAWAEELDNGGMRVRPTGGDALTGNACDSGVGNGTAQGVRPS